MPVDLKSSTKSRRGMTAALLTTLKVIHTVYHELFMA